MNVALIRSTTADPAGNITMEREALVLDAQAAAMAARNADGLVIAPVKQIAATGSLDARGVVVTGALVDCVVVALQGTRCRPMARVTAPRSRARYGCPSTRSRRRRWMSES